VFVVDPVYGELYGTGLFEEMSISTDEDEHSIEMQLPYIAKVMERLLHLLVVSYFVVYYSAVHIILRQLTVEE
jgi:predicted class III extradiol MEMO1 family dioxygenase